MTIHRSCRYRRHERESSRNDDPPVVAVHGRFPRHSDRAGGIRTGQRTKVGEIYRAMTCNVLLPCNFFGQEEEPV
jgi:hypothetical protein